jgi:hypothetical protein
MATRHSRITIWDEDIRISPYGVHSGTDITVQNLDGSNYAYLGGPGVNSNNFGYRLAPGAAISFELPGKDTLYAYSDNEIDIAVLMTGLESGS